MSEPKCKFELIKPGDHLSEVQYYKVTHVEQDRLTVQNERGYKIEVTKGVIEEGMHSASQYTSEEKVTRTQLCEILERAGDTVFTVCFHKKIKEKDVSESVLAALEGADFEDAKALEKIVRSTLKTALQGTERTLVGYLIQTEAKMGRSEVIDLEAQGSHRLRLVDHRTIDWIIIKNVRYSVK